MSWYFKKYKRTDYFESVRELAEHYTIYQLAGQTGVSYRHLKRMIDIPRCFKLTDKTKQKLRKFINPIA